MNKQFCESCGTRNTDNFNFCQNCGNNLEAGNPFSNNNSPEMRVNNAHRQSGDRSGEMFSSLSNYDEEYGESSSSKGNVIIGICIACSLLLFGGLISSIVALIVYLPFKKQKHGWVFFVAGYIFTATITTFLFR